MKLFLTVILALPILACLKEAFIPETATLFVHFSVGVCSAMLSSLFVKAISGAK